tara:strand:+ start:450 stop:665 length:216 start_codon:yes stop_codon:yes gene_type:complete
MYLPPIIILYEFITKGYINICKATNFYKAKYVKGAINSKALKKINKIEVKINTVININLIGSFVRITNLYN